MKRVISWVVLWLISCVVGLVIALVTMLASVLLKQTMELSLLAQIVKLIFYGAIFLAFIFAPAQWGALLAVAASEAVSPSKKGTRYVVFPVLAMIDVFAKLLIHIVNGNLKFGLILMFIYYVVLLIHGRSIAVGKQN